MRSSSSSIFDRSRSQNSVNSASSRRHSKTLYWTERLHAALVLEKELLAAFLVEIGPTVPGLEMVRVEDLVAEEVQGQGFDEDGPEGFEEVQCERPAASRAARAWEVICTDSAMMRRSRSRMGISRRTSSRWVASLRPKTWRRSLLRLMRQPCWLMAAVGILIGECGVRSADWGGLRIEG